MKDAELNAQLLKRIAKYKAAEKLFYKMAKQVEILEKVTITSKEAAILLGVQPRTIRNYNASGKLRGRKYTKGGILYFRAIEVLKFRDTHLKNWD